MLASDSHTLEGSLGSLARDLRCDESELRATIPPLRDSKIGEVTIRGDYVTITCRRLLREHKSREDIRLRVSRHRGNKVGNKDPSVSVSPSESESLGNGGPGERGLPGPAPFPEIAVELPVKMKIPENVGPIFMILHGEIGKAYGRSPLQHWTYEEERLLSEVCRQVGAEKEWLEIFAYHRKEPRYKRATVLSLLQNWPGELDKARGYDAAKAAADGKKLRDPGVPSVQQVRDYANIKAEGDDRAPNWATSFHGYWADPKRDWKRHGKTIDWKIELANQIIKWRTTQ